MLFDEFRVTSLIKFLFLLPLISLRFRTISFLPLSPSLPTTTKIQSEKIMEFYEFCSQKIFRSVWLKMTFIGSGIYRHCVVYWLYCELNDKAPFVIISELTVWCIGHHTSPGSFGILSEKGNSHIQLGWLEKVSWHR